jgi:hypothetical protein
MRATGRDLHDAIRRDRGGALPLHAASPRQVSASAFCWARRAEWQP